MNVFEYTILSGCLMAFIQFCLGLDVEPVSNRRIFSRVGLWLDRKYAVREISKPDKVNFWKPAFNCIICTAPYFGLLTFLVFYFTQSADWWWYFFHVAGVSYTAKLVL